MNKEFERQFQELNQKQKEIVLADGGPILVIAGAGSGKTKVLTFRIAYLVNEKKLDPSRIVAMTFTNKAAGEMKERVNGLIGKMINLWIGTFHSIFARMLRQEAPSAGYGKDFSIYDTDDQLRLIKSIIENNKISVDQYSAKSVLDEISRAKNNLVSPDAYRDSARSYFEEIVSKIYHEYVSNLQKNNAFDFDDLITVPLRIFSANKEILEKYQNRFRYILVDEFQDTNRAQYLLLRYLVGEERNIFVVGDDDQSIYRWRGADIRNILDFEKDFPDAKIFRMEQNYRSTQNILAAANSLVSYNRSRREKNLWSNREPGEKVTLIEVENERSEAKAVVEKIKDEVFKNKRSFQDFAILYRTNAQSRVLEDQIRQSGMSYIIVGGLRFYERKEIKDILAYLKLITNSRDDISLKRIINFPQRGIGQRTLEKVQNWSSSKGMSMFESLRDINSISDISQSIKDKILSFYKLIKKYIDLKDTISPNELVHALVDEISILKMYKEEGTIEAQERAANIRELLSAVSEYARRSETPSLSGFLEEVSLITDIDSWDDRANAITLMTLHSAKGLEFPVVLITGLEEDLLPIAQSREDQGRLEEERRLFYVGLTRAKDKVYLFTSQRRSLFEDVRSRLPSRFIDEIEPEVVQRINYLHKNNRQKSHEKRLYDCCDHHPDYENFSQEESDVTVGTWVFHQKYGKGRVVKINRVGKEIKISVKFGDNDIRKFIASYTKFTIL